MCVILCRGAPLSFLHPTVNTFLAKSVSSHTGNANIAEFPMKPSFDVSRIKDSFQASVFIRKTGVLNRNDVFQRHGLPLWQTLV